IIGSEISPSNLVLSGSSSNPTLIPNSNILFGGSGSSRTVTLVPAADQSGTAMIAITVADTGSNSASTAFLLTVRGLNFPPTLDPIGPVTINEDAGIQTIALTGISSGSSNENQILIVTASSSNPAVIPDPAVNYSTPSATGTLTFAPLTNANGSATI